MLSSREECVAKNMECASSGVSDHRNEILFSWKGG